MVKKAASTRDEWIRWQLRRLSFRWPPRGAAFREAARTRAQFEAHPGVKPASVSARVRNFFECAICRWIFPRRNVSADHIEPVVNPRKGFIGWDDYLDRLFCEKEGFQIICDDDHNAKTKDEGKERTAARRARKK